VWRKGATRSLLGDAPSSNSANLQNYLEKKMAGRSVPRLPERPRQVGKHSQACGTLATMSGVSVPAFAPEIKTARTRGKSDDKIVRRERGRGWRGSSQAGLKEYVME
jgi:hypothetical protein